ncbi:hypothetical protein DRQ32_12165 [bacterium]|nr:MAG: hypothetical protein DRQ32_12165 [bacterium]
MDLLQIIVLAVFFSININTFASEPCFDQEITDNNDFSGYEERARQGDARAQFYLAEMYYSGKGVAQDYQQALHWYQKSAEQLNESALLELGRIYQKGLLVPRDDLKAYTYLQTALTIKIGRHHFGPGPSADIFTDRDQVAESLTSNQIKKIKVDIHNSLREKGYDLKNEKNNAFDILLNAEMFSKYRIDQDYHALMLYSYATKYGGIYASELWGSWFKQGTRLVDYSSAEAFQHYKSRAQDGDSREQLDLSYAYLYGNKLHRSPVLALEWCLAATKPKEYDSILKQDVVQPNKKPDGLNIMAIYLVAWMYDTAQGIPQDYKQAFEWYEKAADLGYGDAQLRLAQMYQQGQGIEQSNDLALHWYKTAAQQGYNKAQRILADHYRAGTLVEQNKQQAFEWYKKAAVLEELEAQYALAQMYANGEGTTQDTIKAYILSIYLAENYNHTDAKILCKQLEQQLSQTELKQAKALGRRWQEDAKYRTLGVAVPPPFDW